ncbi:MAG: nucleotide exchange factor GrpE [Casimicrobiaceae bacterium]|nr:nucleotide exchange factor GrpE [Casimicrobiaceae bacterium]
MTHPDERSRQQESSGELSAGPADPIKKPADGETERLAPESTQEADSAALTAELASLKDQLLRALAEQQNMQRRHAQELANARDYAMRDFAFDLLAVKDTLERILDDRLGTIEQIKTGAEMTLRQLVTTFERYKIVEVPARGEKFDPNLHEALSHVESDAPPGTVVEVFRKGYLIAGRCLRPALVSVAKAKASNPPADSPAAEAATGPTGPGAP